MVELFERASPSVVGVTVITGADDPAKFHVGKGSGFIWDAMGDIATKEHIVHVAGTITVWLASGEELTRSEARGASTNPWPPA